MLSLKGDAQLIDTARFNLQLLVDGKYVAHGLQSEPKLVHADSYLTVHSPYKQRRHENSDSLYETDNPIAHGAYYFRITGKTAFNNKYTLYTNAVFEHRGFSYGPNDLKNIVIYPQAYLDVQDTFRIKSSEFVISGLFGDIWDFQINNGLKMYNLDAQGMKLQLRWNRLFYRYDLAGDLSFGIGINLNEIHQHTLGYGFNLRNGGHWEAGITFADNSTASLRRPFSGVEKKPEYGFFTTFAEGALKVYTEAGLNARPYIDVPSNMAFLLGLDYRFNAWNTGIRLNPEVRYYGKMYNAAYFNDHVILYRDSTLRINYANTTGRYHYPVKNFFNPFSQWAVYTEYQGLDVMGLEFRSSLEKPIIKKLHATCTIESVTIFKEHTDLTYGNQLFSYLFYEIGLRYNIVDKVYTTAFVHNKAMNLDKPYQTFYMVQKPYIGFSVRKEL